ncbi:YgfZ/GcvT domain-containing protein [Pseudofulvimonas gallinarii]|jgi:folate-binding protein YgfZ|uniref:Aminomethyltransferase folate-binding domain-containing protein n=1 Tax=Pseudofulvimonas gallinarii TaxID=634155 RepID=A0A4R3LLH8_9GAMM|nr:folate-binding protein YgfZ [Pseudofulvimonas gallinarii]TCT01152.1 hypothetical protein EDC25_1016 [Pseudofulvimonas gallinarii]
MCTRLPDSEILQLSGADAVPFAQAQFMNNATALADSGWHWNGWLNAKGRLVAFFALVRADAQTLLLWLPAGGAAALASSLQRFVFRAKVRLDATSSWQAAGCFTPPPAGTGDIVIDLPGEDAGSRRYLWLHQSGSGPGIDESKASRWRLADLRIGVPYISPGQPGSEQFVPQWLSLDRLHAFDLKKGCYPGQEIVARMHYLGQSKRAAFVLSGPGEPPPAMTRVTGDGDTAAGEIVWAIGDSEGWHALAVMSKERTEGPLRLATGVAVQIDTSQPDLRPADA